MLPIIFLIAIVIVVGFFSLTGKKRAQGEDLGEQR
jgi:hypothetical protein